MRSGRWGAVLLLALVGWGAGGGVAMAHSMSPAGVVSIAATLGDRELTVTVSLPSGGTGALPVVVAVQGPAPDATLRLQAVPGTTGDAATSEATVRIGPTQRIARTVLQIDRPGPWQIVVGDGRTTARLPLTLDAAEVPGWAWAVRIGLGAAVVCTIAAFAMLARRRTLVAAGLGGVAIAGIAVVVTAALLAGSVPAAAPGAGGFVGAAAPPGAPAAMPGMDMSAMSHGDMRSDDGPVVLGLRTSPTAPTTGQTLQLTLDFTDGATGTPVDDLAVHDDALIHLAVISPQRRLRHVHPVRTAPGRYTVDLTPSDPGRYGVFAELERAGGGHQVVRSAFTVAGTAQPAGPAAGLTVDATMGSPVAGRPAPLSLTFADKGTPVNLQAWLGMAGHLLVLGPVPPGTDATAATFDPADPTLSFAHAHDMDPPGPTGYGPTIAFTYAFPRAGHYQLWAQVQRDWQLVTVPLTVDVAPAPA